MRVGDGKLGEKLFTAAAKVIQSPVSPKGKTVTGPEMGVAVRLLGIDGMSLGKRELLHEKLGGAKRDPAANGLFVTVTGGIASAQKVESGSYLKVAGTAFTREEENAPWGTWLKLHEPVKVGSQWTEEVHLWGGELAPGTFVNLQGRLDARQGWGDNTTLEYVTLSGASNLDKGEPTYDGEGFTTSAGKPAAVVSYDAPMIMDEPAMALVLDQGADKAFIGAMGGFMPMEANPFHGFRASRSIESATAADQAKLKFVGGKPVNKATGKDLVSMGKEGAHEWFLDEAHFTAYRVVQGTTVDQVVRFQEGDYPYVDFT